MVIHLSSTSEEYDEAWLPLLNCSSLSQEVSGKTAISAVDKKQAIERLFIFKDVVVIVEMVLCFKLITELVA